jgi:hypothetical protein
MKLMVGRRRRNMRLEMFNMIATIGSTDIMRRMNGTTYIIGRIGMKRMEGRGGGMGAMIK